jgi:hypothetical protein
MAVTLKDDLEKDLEKIKSIVSVIRQKSLVKEEIKQVVHYSKLTVADIITSSRESRLHYSNVIYMNDPQEGKIFIDYLDDPIIKEWFEKASYKNESTIFLGSFLPVQIADDDDGRAEDQLLLWRTYGKDENGIDAGGCNFVINADFFETDKTLRSLPKSFEKIKNEIENGTKYIVNNRNSLLYVQYIRGNKILKDDKDLLINLIDYLKKEIKQLIQKNNGNVSEESARNYINSRIFDALQELCHLFKSADYSFEKEVRIIKAEARNSRNIEYYKSITGDDPNPPKHFYVKSEKRVLPYLAKIYLGPKVKNSSHWGLHFDYSLRKEERELAELETLEEKFKNTMKLDPIEKDRLDILQQTYPGGKTGVTEPIVSNKIEIIPSKCHFI